MSTHLDRRNACLAAGATADDPQCPCRRYQPAGAWKVPAWMEPHRAKIVGNGEPIERLMNTGPEVNVFNNAPLAVIVCTVKAQVGLLERLHAAGVL